MSAPRMTVQLHAGFIAFSSGAAARSQQQNARGSGQTTTSCQRLVDRDSGGITRGCALVQVG